MKLLDIFNDAFKALPKNGNIRAFLKEQKVRFGPEDFCCLFFNWFGSRAANEFLDYGLAALKFQNLFKNEYPCYSFKYGAKEGEIDTYINEKIVYHFLFDDRHDLSQNVPYHLNDFLEANKDKTEELGDFWDNVADILIDSFNENGTGDVAVKNLVS